MNMNPLTNKRALMMAALPLTLLLTGCSLTGSSSKTPPPPPVGVYRSNDQGATWTVKDTVITTSPPAIKNLNATNALLLSFDPTDRSALYLGTPADGLYYTYNQAESWLADGVGGGQPVNAIAIPNSVALRCTIYMASGNKVYKTTDCGRHWDEMFRDPRSGLRVFSVAVHQTNPSIILAGLSTGEINRSTDGGSSWTTVARLGHPIRKILPSAQDDKLFYAVLQGQGIVKSIDGGLTWVDVSDGLKKLSGARTIRDISMDPNHPTTLLLATDYGLVQTTDGGTTWQGLTLLTPPGKVKISSAAYNPQKTSEMYYTTDTTLYHSVDGGKSWETKPLPVSGTTSMLLVDPQQPTTLYLGLYRGKTDVGPLGL